VRRRILCQFALSALLINAPGVAVTTAGAMPPAPPPTNAPYAVLLDVKGLVELNRRGWDGFKPVTDGTLLQRLDLLRLSGGASARVVCSDGVSKPLKSASYPQGVKCPPAPRADPGIFQIVISAFVYHIRLVGPTRNETNDTVPLVLTPRASKLAGPLPVIRWQAPIRANDDTTYVVALKSLSDGRVVWTDEATGTELIPDPNKQPKLKPGERYRVVVSVKGCTEPGGCSSEQNAVAGEEFTVLPEGEADNVRSDLDRILALDLGEQSKRLVVARYYVSKGLYAEAVSLLEGPDHRSQLPAEMNTLGEVYAATGLVDQAATYFKNASDAAQIAGDVFSKAMAESARGMIFEKSNYKSEAVDSYTKAELLYKELGDKAATEELRKKIEALRPPRPKTSGKARPRHR
jgi:hypothetical protein